MELKKQIAPEKIKTPVSSIILYVAFSVTAILALASLINTIIIYNDNADHYVKMGYPAAEVIKQLVQTQLLPGLFQSIAVYGGIAVILLGAGIINHKISNCLILLSKDQKGQTGHDAVEESVQEKNAPGENEGSKTLGDVINEDNMSNEDNSNEENSNIEVPRS